MEFDMVPLLYAVAFGSNALAETLVKTEAELDPLFSPGRKQRRVEAAYVSPPQLRRDGARRVA